MLATNSSEEKREKIGITRFSNSPARNPSEAFSSMIDLPTVKSEEPVVTTDRLWIQEDNSLKK
jgi:hypothetical protein